MAPIRTALLLLAALAIAGCQETETARDADGGTREVRVVDGDTLVLGTDDRIRMHGIDAPERAQTCLDARSREWACGRAATAHLERLIAGRPVACETRDTDRYGRRVAVCRAGGTDLNAALVEAGLALAYTRYADDYAPLEARARSARRGVWAGRFQRPEEWRRNGPEAAPTTASAECTIKGNITGNGRIYHTPDSPWYGRTRISPADGERWFCSAEEAEAAGWRPVRGTRS